MSSVNSRRLAAALIAAMACAWTAGAVPARAQEANRATAPITVGPNVQVSSTHGERPHAEVIAAADPKDARRMIACSMVSYRTESKTGQHCYSSFDTGRTWEPTLVLNRGYVNGDPTAAYARGDTAFVVSLVADTAIPRWRWENRTRVFRSVDGARTWKETADYRFIDREWVVVDRTGGTYDGRVYVNGQASVRGMRDERPAGIYLFHSKDGGTTIQGPAVRLNMQGGGPAGVTNMVVLSDGAVGRLFGHTKAGRQQDLTISNADRSANATLEFLYSKDGGDTFEPSVIVSQFYMDRPRSEGGNIGQLAVDATSGPFKDRLYAVWPDARSERLEVLLSYSDNKGRSWSPPIAVNDDRSFADMARKRDHILPAVAVNKDGVVLVTWYDRRESTDNLGWRVRAAASLDGGETFASSVAVSSGANAYTPQTTWPIGLFGSMDSTRKTVSVGAGFDSFFDNGGHTTGLVADADGVFHPVWVDNRTGVSQIWTAPVTVRGRGLEHGSSTLAEMENVSTKVELYMTNGRFDRKSNTLAMSMVLRNISKDTIAGPLKLRVVRLQSEMGTPELLGAEDGVTGVGAVLDLTPMLPAGRLLPGSASAARELVFRYTDLQPFKHTRQFRNRAFVNLEGRVFGASRKEVSTR